MDSKNLIKLKDKFDPKDLEWRVQSSGKKNGEYWALILAYIDARAVQDRLDEVCGGGSWQTEYQQIQGGIICKLSINVDGQWITKADVSQETDIEAIKGGFSKSLVRAASAWGTGRYLYDLETTWALIVDKGTQGSKSAKTKEGEWFNWVPPKLPLWAMPDRPVESKDIPVVVREVIKPPPASPATAKPKQTVTEVRASATELQLLFKIAEANQWKL